MHRASSLNTDDSWLYEDGHDEIVLSVDQPCQLLGVGLCGTEGAYTAELELLEVRALQPASHVCVHMSDIEHACQSLLMQHTQLLIASGQQLQMHLPGGTTVVTTTPAKLH